MLIINTGCPVMRYFYHYILELENLLLRKIIVYCGTYNNVCNFPV